MKIILLAFALVLLSVLTFLTLNIQPVKAALGNITIRAEGIVEGTTEITTDDNTTYTFTNNIFNQSIVVERDNIVVDGAGYVLQGTAAYDIGINLTRRSNVTIRNMEVKAFDYGIWLDKSSSISIYDNVAANNNIGIYFAQRSDNNHVYRNTITGNEHGIYLKYDSDHNSIYGNRILANNYGGIWLYSSSVDNIIFGNSIAGNTYYGIGLSVYSNFNRVSGNNITNSHYGIELHKSSNNIICHNNFIANGAQVYDPSWDHPNYSPSTNIWDLSYPSEGNYWSDYEDRYPDAEEGDCSGTWDTPYFIDERNQDNYPLMGMFSPVRHDIAVGDVTASPESVTVGEIVIITITIENEGDFTETFNVTAYCDSTDIGTRTMTNLIPTAQETLTFTLNMARLDVGYYNVKVMAAKVDNETDMADNTFTDGIVMVKAEPSPPFWTQWWLWTVIAAGIVVLTGAVYLLKKRKQLTPTAPAPPRAGQSSWIETFAHDGKGKAKTLVETTESLAQAQFFIRMIGRYSKHVLSSCAEDRVQ